MAMNLKNIIKNSLLQRLHAREEIVSRIATRVVREGVPRRLNWSFEGHADNTMRYLASCNRGGFDYSFCASVSTPVLYGSVYAFMLHSMLRKFSASKQIGAWIDYFDGFQTDDGQFRDPTLAGDAFEHIGGWGEGWGVRHITAHMITPYARAGRRPALPFRFLEPHYEPGSLDTWLGKFNFREQLWSQSNHVMNLYSVLQFARDHMAEPRAGFAVDRIANWLRETQNPETGMWHDGPLTSRAQMNDAIRAAYHYYPLFEYDGHHLPFQQQTIDAIIKTQNSWGAFEEEDRPAGACEDIDALDPLLRFAQRTGHRQDDVTLAAERAFVWILSCRNEDGGSASMPEHGFHYGNHPLTTSKTGESNLLATWFRTLNVAYLSEFIGLPQKFVIGRYPGYEIPLPQRKCQ
jgi:hypothetical protein